MFLNIGPLECFSLFIIMQQGDEKIVLKAANLCYVDEKMKIKEKFQSIMEKKFGAQAKGVNFSDPKTRKKINSTVEELTNKKIEDLLSKGNELLSFSIDSL